MSCKKLQSFSEASYCFCCSTFLHRYGSVPQEISKSCSSSIHQYIQRSTKIELRQFSNSIWSNRCCFWWNFILLLLFFTEYGNFYSWFHLGLFELIIDELGRLEYDTYGVIGCFGWCLYMGFEEVCFGSNGMICVLNCFRGNGFISFPLKKKMWFGILCILI